ncbi:MAG: DUF2934 domain-containing protein [Bacteroidales bacterium]|jgi:hypothetical protein
MGNIIVKTKKSKVDLTATSRGKKRIISDDDIRKRAYEIYKENDDPSCSELDNWYYAERELNGFYL